MSRYVPASVYAIHNECKSHIRFKVEFPRADRDAAREMDRRRKILSAFLLGCINGIGSRVAAGARDSSAAVLDFLSPFVRIVCPPLRPVNFELLTGRERADVEALIGVLLSTSSTFRAAHPGFDQADADGFGAMKYRLDPYVCQLFRRVQTVIAARTSVCAGSFRCGSCCAGKWTCCSTSKASRSLKARL